MRRLLVHPLSLAGVSVVERIPLVDGRGMFERLFCRDELAELGFVEGAVQINRSMTLEPGTARGFHFQYPPHSETKLVSCLVGRVLDVVVDVRCGSPTFLQSVAVELSADKALSMLIPPGCAHGFQCLEPHSELLYIHSAAYCADAEGGLNLLDPSLGIRWPLEVRNLSARDAAHPLLNEDFLGVTL